MTTIRAMPPPPSEAGAVMQANIDLGALGRVAEEVTLEDADDDVPADSTEAPGTRPPSGSRSRAGHVTRERGRGTGL